MYDLCATFAFFVCMLLAIAMFIFSGVYIVAWIVMKLCDSFAKTYDEQLEKQQKEEKK